MGFLCAGSSSPFKFLRKQTISWRFMFLPVITRKAKLRYASSSSFAMTRQANGTAGKRSIPKKHTQWISFNLHWKKPVFRYWLGLGIFPIKALQYHHRVECGLLPKNLLSQAHPSPAARCRRTFHGLAGRFGCFAGWDDKKPTAMADHPQGGKMPHAEMATSGFAV